MLPLLPFLVMTANSTYKVAPALERLDRPEVRLSGPLHDQVAGVVRNWLIPLPKKDPAILTMFNDRDQEPYHNLLAWSGEFAGKYLTSGTETYRITGDAELKKTLAKFVESLAKCQDADGYLGPFPKANRLTGWAPNTWGSGGDTWDAWGHYHAIVGLLNWHDETGDATALAAARKIGDLLVKTYELRTVASTGSPAMNQAIVHGLALLYRETGERTYLEGAERVVREFGAQGAGNYLQAALAGEEFYKLPNAGPRWESLHSIMGLAELYWETGNPDYRMAFEHLYWSIAKTDVHNNGGFTSGEQAQGDPYHRGAIETCCTIAWSAMGVEMLRMSADSRVADELELALLNQVVGLHAADGSWCTYNTPMEGVRIPSKEDIAFQIRPGSEDLNCCSVNAARGFGLIADWGLMRRDDGLVLNYYGPSEFRARLAGAKVTLRQDTTYPREGQITLHVDPDHPAKFPLSLRVPHWSARTSIKVNGKAASAKPGTYAILDREWRRGDTVTIDLDMTPRFWVGERESQGTASVYRGPILYAMEAPNLFPTYSKEWETAGDLRVTKTKGASMEFKFEGDLVRWRGKRFDDAGLAEVQVDGKVVDTLDLYDPERDKPFVWEKAGFGPGSHTICIVALGTKREASKNAWINVGAIEPVPARTAFDVGAFAEGAFSPTSGAVGAWTVLDRSGRQVTLCDYGSVGRNRMPYLTWFPIADAPIAAFSKENPSRTSR